jgi:hypothetical protein
MSGMNITVDDRDPQVTYVGSRWHAQPGCTICTAIPPDSDNIFNHTWHDGLFGSTNPDDVFTAQLTFTGAPFIQVLAVSFLPVSQWLETHSINHPQAPPSTSSVSQPALTPQQILGTRSRTSSSPLTMYPLGNTPSHLIYPNTATTSLSYPSPAWNPLNIPS